MTCSTNRRPGLLTTTEFHAARQLHPIANRDDDVKVVELRWAVGICNVQHIAFLLQFTLLENVVDMLRNYRSINAEQLRHWL